MVIIQNTNLYLQSDIDTWVAANSPLVEKIGSLYLINGNSSGTNFRDVLVGYNGATILEHSIGTEFVNSRHTIRDLGKEIYFGTSQQSKIVVMRLVQLSSSDDSGAGGRVGYVVTQNNRSDITRPRFLVNVCMV
jgi:hypothetical protein